VVVHSFHRFVHRFVHRRRSWRQWLSTGLGKTLWTTSLGLWSEFSTGPAVGSEPVAGIQECIGTLSADEISRIHVLICRMPSSDLPIRDDGADGFTGTVVAVVGQWHSDALGCFDEKLIGDVADVRGVRVDGHCVLFRVFWLVLGWDGRTAWVRHRSAGPCRSDRHSASVSGEVDNRNQIMVWGHHRVVVSVGVAVDAPTVLIDESRSAHCR